MLEMGTGTTPIYCHMTSTGLGPCGGGGWTLALKIDGTEVNWAYYRGSSRRARQRFGIITFFF